MATVIGSSPDAGSPGVLGENTNTTPAAGVGVHGKSRAAGVVGEGTDWHGVSGQSSSTVGGAGVHGKGKAGNFGVLGESTTGAGVEGRSQNGPGVVGQSEAAGVWGRSKKWVGVYGETEGVDGGPAGVWGEHKGAGVGVKAVSKSGAALAAYSEAGDAVHAESVSGPGVVAKSKSGVGLLTTSEAHEAVHAETNSPGTAAIAAYNVNASGTGAAIFARKLGSLGHAAFLDGNVFVTGDISCQNADCAEDFDVTEGAITDPGTVMVLSGEGTLEHCTRDYDNCVMGVVSGAGGYKPGLVLDKQLGQQGRKPVALMGKVFCKVDADYGAIQPGDLLTTSPTAGHAMKATEPHRAFGAVIGKALGSAPEGTMLIPILVALQ